MDILMPMVGCGSKANPKPTRQIIVKVLMMSSLNWLVVRQGKWQWAGKRTATGRRSLKPQEVLLVFFFPVAVLGPLGCDAHHTQAGPCTSNLSCPPCSGELDEQSYGLVYGGNVSIPKKKICQEKKAQIFLSYWFFYIYYFNLLVLYWSKPFDENFAIFLRKKWDKNVIFCLLFSIKWGFLIVL